MDFDSSSGTCDLYAYEKALMFSNLTAFIRDNPVRASLALSPVSISADHIDLFRHLQPFMVR